MIAHLYADLTESDRQVVADAGIRKMLVSNFAEGLRRSADGWIDDVMAFTSPWGFDPGQIVVPALLWHGADDRFAPADHGRWLGGRIPGCHRDRRAGQSHFGALRHPPARPSLAGQRRLADQMGCDSRSRLSRSPSRTLATS